MEEGLENWKGLVSCISTSVLDRVIGKASNITETPQSATTARPLKPPDTKSTFQPIDQTSTSRPQSSDNYYAIDSLTTAPQDQEPIPNLPDLPSDHPSYPTANLNLLPISLKQTWPSNAIGRDRTKMAQDRTWYLHHLHSTYYPDNSKDIIGEFQFCYLMALTLGNYSCFEGWSRILEVVLSSIEAAVVDCQFFVTFLETLRCQVERCVDAEGGLLDLNDEAGVKLRSLLHKFRARLEGLDVARVEEEKGKAKTQVLEKLEELEETLCSIHGFDMSGMEMTKGMLDLEDGERVDLGRGREEDAWEDEGEFAPVLVGLSDGMGEGAVLNEDEVRELIQRRRRKGVVREVVEGSSDDESEDDGGSVGNSDRDEDMEVDDVDMEL
ncbi:MAG: hypothetical protein Q9159_007386 [Coniocarpon cinnabarinum]